MTILEQSLQNLEKSIRGLENSIQHRLDSIEHKNRSLQAEISTAERKRQAVELTAKTAIERINVLIDHINNELGETRGAA